MPLILGLRQGSDFFVEDDRFVLHEIRAGNDFDLINEATGKLFTITDAEATEVASDVLISSGDYYAGQVHVVIDAPRDIKIARGKVIRRGEGETKGIRNK